MKTILGQAQTTLWLLAVCGAVMLSATGCATSAAHRAYVEELQIKEAGPALISKAESFDPLSLEDVEDLVAKGIPDETILYHMRKSRAIYRLNTKDVERLKEAGVSDAVIDFMLSTPDKYLPLYLDPYPYYGSYYYGPYYYRPYYYSPYFYCPPYYYPHYYHYHGSGGLRYYRSR